MKVFPEGKLYEKKALCDLIFFRFSRFIHYVVSPYSYLCHVCRTDSSCHPSPGKHAALVSFILSLRFVFSRSCLTLLDNTVICSQRGGSLASWVNVPDSSDFLPEARVTLHAADRFRKPGSIFLPFN